MTTIRAVSDKLSLEPQSMLGPEQGHPTHTCTSRLSVEGSCALTDGGYLLTTATAGAGPGSVEVSGGTFSLRLPADGWCGSLMACVLTGHRGVEWLERGLFCSK